MFNDCKYVIYSSGKIFNKNGNELKQYIDKHGYHSVSINKKRYLIHRLVAENFSDDFFIGCHVHHIDMNKSNNDISNLQCITKEKHQHIHKQKYPITKYCCICGCEFTPNKTKRKIAKTCSKECSHKLTILNSQKRKRKIIQFSKDNTFIREWDSARDCQREKGFYESNINKCCNGIIKSYKGYIWKYKGSD